MEFSVVIPTLNEERYIAGCIQSVLASDADVEIIVVDGGSTDRTRELAANNRATVLHTGRGRGAQLNYGAANAHGDILVFLHADTVVSTDMFAMLRKCFRHPRVKIGTCRLAFDRRHPLLRLYAYCARLESPCTTFGDQCIVCRKSFFELNGEFPEWPLFEDVAFLHSARRKTEIHFFPTTVVTSARKFVRNGIIRQQFRNAALLTLYAVGVSPLRLARMYYQKSTVHDTILPRITGDIHKHLERSEAL
jgi:rSAM/selenodomain-associated transferase 2